MNLIITGYYLMLIYNGNVWGYCKDTMSWVPKLADATRRDTPAEAEAFRKTALSKGQNQPFVADNWGRAQKIAA